MQKVKIIPIGNALGIVLNKEVLKKLGCNEGDEIFLIEAEDGYKIVSYDPDYERQMKISEKIRKKYKNTLKMLSKS